MQRGWRLTAAASADVEKILDESLLRFGPEQAIRYAALIDRIAALAAEEPERPASRSHAALGPGIRSLHLSLAAPRASAAAHVIFYRLVPGHRSRTVVVLRVLHERMDPTLHMTDDA